MEQWPNPGSRVQNYWVAPRSTQPFIFLRWIQWVPGISCNSVVKSKVPPRSCCCLEAVEPHPYKGAIKFFFNFHLFILVFLICDCHLFSVGLVESSLHDKASTLTWLSKGQSVILNSYSESGQLVILKKRIQLGVLQQ